MTAASRDDDPLDGSLTTKTPLALASVNPVFQLERTFLPIGINVVRH